MRLLLVMLFVFLCLFNNLIGFFFFYEGLAIGGVAKVSQIDLFRPFLTFFFSVVFLEEQMNVISVVVMVAAVTSKTLQTYQITQVLIIWLLLKI